MSPCTASTILQNITVPSHFNWQIDKLPTRHIAFPAVSLKIVDNGKNDAYRKKLWDTQGSFSRKNLPQDSISISPPHPLSDLLLYLFFRELSRAKEGNIGAQFWQDFHDEYGIIITLYTFLLFIFQSNSNQLFDIVYCTSFVRFFPELYCINLENYLIGFTGAI